MNGQKYTYSIKTDKLAPKEYYQAQLKYHRRVAGEKLYELLYTQKLPAVVDIDEEVIPIYGRENSDELRITITVTPVQHRNIVLQNVLRENFNAKLDQQPELTRLQRLVKPLKLLWHGITHAH